MTDGFDLMARIHAIGGTIKVLDRPALDLTTPMGKALLRLLSSVHQEERERIVSRAKEGIREAKRRNVKFGRKPKLSNTEAIEARRLIQEGQSFRTVAGLFSVHHQTSVGWSANLDNCEKGDRPWHEFCIAQGKSPAHYRHADIECPGPGYVSSTHRNLLHFRR
jgi:DNA invertase Pin-like site-specific DNA recombinase